MFRRSLVLMVLAFATPVLAEPHVLTNSEIKSVITGSLMAIDAPMGQTIPVRFGQDGLISGEVGILAAVLGARKDRGRWWVADNHLCLKFFRWFDAKERCITVQMDGNKLWWSEPSGENGTATLAERGATPNFANVAPAQIAAAPVPKPLSKSPAAVPRSRIETQSRESDTEPAQKNDITPPLPRPPGTALLAFISPAAAAEISKPNKLAGTTGVAALTEKTAVAQTPAANPIAPVAWQKRAEKSKPAAIDRRQTVAASKPSVPPKVAPEPPTPSYRVARVDNDDVLNVRSGPSEYAEQIGTIDPDGHGVRITGECQGLWCPVRYARTLGWVNRYYLAEDLPETGASKP